MFVDPYEEADEEVWDSIFSNATVNITSDWITSKL